MPKWWEAPRLWSDPGALCYIVGGGPSLRGFDFEKLRGQHVIAVNCACEQVPFADALFFGDYEWGVGYRSLWKTFHGMVITCHADWLQNTSGVKVMNKEAGYGLTDHRDAIAFNQNSGAGAINLAVHFGARRIVLLGFDQKVDGNATHYHSYYKRGVEKDPNWRYRKYILAFPFIAEHLERRGISVVNACPDSAITCWPRVPRDSVLPPY